MTQDTIYGGLAASIIPKKIPSCNSQDAQLKQVATPRQGKINQVFVELNNLDILSPAESSQHNNSKDKKDGDNEVYSRLIESGQEEGKEFFSPDIEKSLDRKSMASAPFRSTA